MRVLFVLSLFVVSVGATEYGRFFHGFDEKAESMLQNFTSGLTKNETAIFLDIFGSHKDDDRLAENEDLWNQPEVVDRLVMLTEEILEQLNVSKDLNTYFSKSIPPTIEMAKNQIVNSPVAREKTRKALSYIMELYDKLSTEEKAIVKEVDEMTVLLLEHEGLRSQLKETEEPSTTMVSTTETMTMLKTNRVSKPNSASSIKLTLFMPVLSYLIVTHLL
ncbi:unnamed protein product [Bursaphelenchus okinawaensis]|uniref:Fatty-acid and retinol-binding protein 1 n=1 Tax=Bursaphelenchus okinawaensis TaxID=465554 RepID=A0A811L707_9BILA|nr:unnamed protein product [Bursaphelenchus okinawaensis]CAG9118021.1 unnamed protein product [Bursaphelenchus okinawaensis]